MAAPSGIVWGSIAGSYGRIGIYVSLTNTATQTTRHTEIWFWSKYSVSDTSNTFYYDDNATSATTSKGSVSISTTVASGSGWSTSNQVKLKEYDYTFTKGTSSSKRSVAAKLTSVDRVGATMTALTSYTIPALASYTVSYNANGGSGAPTSQTKWYGKALTLSSTKPTRTGYSFQGWATSASGSVAYAAGGSYTSNAAITLYAVWKANTYTVSYNANGGSGAPSSQTKTYGINLTLSSTKPTRANYNFKGWATSSNGSVAYAAGGTYTSNAAITLYAVWELAYVIPRITGLTVTRCDSSGTAGDNGTYAKVAFSWATDKTVSAIKIEWKSNTDTASTSVTASASGTSGSVSQIVGGSLDVEKAYNFTITVTDSLGSKQAFKTINGQIFPIDALAGGNGVAFGKAAENPNEADFNYPIRARKGLQPYGTNTITSTADDTTGNWGQYGFSYHFYMTAGQLINQPSQWGYLLNIGTGAEIHQLWLTQASGDLYHRGGNGSGWSGTWRKILDSSNYSSYVLPLTGGTLTGLLKANSGIVIPNEGSTAEPNNRIMGTTTSGAYHHLLSISSNDNCAVNYGSYKNGIGALNLYTSDIVNIITKDNGSMYISGRSLGFKGDYNSNFFISCKWADDTLHDIVSRSSDGLRSYFGPGSLSGYNTTTNIRGYYVRLYAHSGGAVYLGSSGSTAITSDRNLKKDIYDLNDKYVRFFNNLRPITYKYSESGHRDHIGFIAQEVEEALEKAELTSEEFAGLVIDKDITLNPNHDSSLSDEENKSNEIHYDKLYSLRYEEFIALNTHMIKKQQTKIQSLESEVTSLKDELAKLKELINTLVKSA